MRTWRRGRQFTTGGAENPTLTTVTLAIRQADYIADQLSKNNIRQSETRTCQGGAYRPRGFGAMGDCLGRQP